MRKRSTEIKPVITNIKRIKKNVFVAIHSGILSACFSARMITWALRQEIVFSSSASSLPAARVCCLLQGTEGNSTYEKKKKSSMLFLLLGALVTKTEVAITAVHSLFLDLHYPISCQDCIYLSFVIRNRQGIPCDKFWPMICKQKWHVSLPRRYTLLLKWYSLEISIPVAMFKMVDAPLSWIPEGL